MKPEGGMQHKKIVRDQNSVPDHSTPPLLLHMHNSFNIYLQGFSVVSSKVSK